MSLTFKLLSLAIRTAAKPFGNYIKRQAREHEGFRKFAVAQAQRVHRIDMRMRLGILHDPEAQQRMYEREQRAAEERKRKAEQPTVRTEEEQKQYEEQKAREAADEAAGKKKEEEHKPLKQKIRPLSEARAIELGANFFSEAFIFAVAAGLLVWDSWRSRKKEYARRDDVADRLEQLEAEVESLRSKLDPDLETLHDLSERVKAARQRRQSWGGWVASGFGLGPRSPEDTAIMEEESDHAQARVNDFTKVKVDGEEMITPIRKAHEDAKAKAAPVEKAREELQKAAERGKAEVKTAERVDEVKATKKER